MELEEKETLFEELQDQLQEKSLIFELSGSNQRDVDWKDALIRDLNTELKKKDIEIERWKSSCVYKRRRWS